MHLRRQVDRLKKQILTLGGIVEQSFHDAVRAVEQRDPTFADKVIENEERIDAMESEIEEECLAALALHQPVAFDLRYIIAILKMSNDLERVGDMAEKIARQAKYLASEEEIDHLPFDLPGMANAVQTMLKNSLDAVVNVDTKLAESVIADDDSVDTQHRRMFDQVEDLLREHPHQISQYLHLMHISRHLERVGDKAVNIAKDVLYMADAEYFKANQNGTHKPVKV